MRALTDWWLCAPALRTNGYARWDLSPAPSYARCVLRGHMTRPRAHWARLTVLLAGVDSVWLIPELRPVRWALLAFPDKYPRCLGTPKNVHETQDI